MLRPPLRVRLPLMVRAAGPVMATGAEISWLPPEATSMPLTTLRVLAPTPEATVYLLALSGTTAGCQLAARPHEPLPSTFHCEPPVPGDRRRMMSEVSALSKTLAANVPSDPETV